MELLDTNTDKQKEGIIIGSILGMVIGNKSGKGHDSRVEQQQWEQQQRELAHRERMRRQEQQRIEQARQYRIQQTRQSSPTFGGSTRSSSDELTQARHRAEQREAELQREMEILRIQQERRRALEEYRQREIQAQQQLERIRNGESVILINNLFNKNAKTNQGFTYCFSIIICGIESRKRCRRSISN